MELCNHLFKLLFNFTFYIYLTFYNTLYRWLRFCVFVLERSGPTFIKLGQWASTRPDLMSKEACQIFSKLFDNVSHNSWSSTRTLLRREWKNEIEDLFDEFDQDPIGAGCMAQVYRGRLRDDVAASFETRDVIVKVARPGVDQLVYEDLTLLYLSCRIIHMFPSMTWISLPAQLLEFGALLKQQLDFTQEASNLQVFSEWQVYVSSTTLIFQCYSL